jgi:hypothetical protein
MSHTGTVKLAFLNKRAQSRLKTARTLVVETWKVLIPIWKSKSKSKRLSYTAKFKREVIQCAEEKGNRKAAAIFGVDESNIRLWLKHKAAMSGCEASRNVQLLQKSCGGCRLHGKPSRRALSSDLSRSVA